MTTFLMKRFEEALGEVRGEGSEFEASGRLGSGTSQEWKQVYQHVPGVRGSQSQPVKHTQKTPVGTPLWLKLSSTIRL